MALLLGKRIGFDKQTFRPHNLPWTVLGAGFLWFGWFGFNGGSALAANAIAANAIVTTNTAAAAAGLAWAFMEWSKHASPTLLGTVSGMVSGLVAITPACGYVSPLSAIFIGILAGIFCFLSVTELKSFFRYDDALDVFGIHGIGGIWGTVATGLLAQKSVNLTGADGLIFGNWHQLLVQLIMVIAAVAFSAFMTFLLYKFVDEILGMRVSEKEELIGLDLTQHNESAYTVLE